MTQGASGDNFDVKIVSKHIPLHRKTISSTLKLLKQTEMTVSKCLKNRIIWFHNLGFIFWSLELGRFYRVKVQTQLAFLTINFARRAWTRYHIRWHMQWRHIPYEHNCRLNFQFIPYRMMTRGTGCTALWHNGLIGCLVASILGFRFNNEFSPLDQMTIRMQLQSSCSFTSVLQYLSKTVTIVHTSKVFKYGGLGGEASRKILKEIRQFWRIFQYLRDTNLH